MGRYSGWDAESAAKLAEKTFLPTVKIVSEKEFMRSVCEAATAYGWTYYHTWNSMHSAAGFPDLVMVRNVRLIFAELKTESGTLTKQQSKWSENLRQTAAE